MRVVAIGMAVTLSVLLVQGVASGLGAESISRLLARRAVGTHFVTNALATLMLILVLLAGHLVQIAVWATVFLVIGEFPAFADAFYHSAVNYTTLGYGDIVMSSRSRLLGPLEAVSGTLAFGWSTAIIVAVVVRLIRVRHRSELRRGGSP
jgi:hypothetical protein